MKNSIDPNLIIFRKIFKVDEILSTYLNLQKFNCYLPENYHQLDLFQCNMNSLALLLGIDKLATNWFQYKFLVENFNQHDEIVQEIKIKSYSVGCDSYQFLSNNRLKVRAQHPHIIAYMKASTIKSDIIQKQNITIKHFLQLFDQTKYR